MKISQPAPTVSDLWDAQVAALITATSIGKLLVDNVDSPISTAKADLTTLETRLSAARALDLDKIHKADAYTASAGNSLGQLLGQSHGLLCDIMNIRLTHARAALLDNLDLAISALSNLGFTDFHHYEDLAGAATYTPPAQTFGTSMTELGVWRDGVCLCYEFFDGGAWIAGQANVEIHEVPSFAQDSAQNFRIKNDAGAALKISMHGQTWS